MKIQKLIPIVFSVTASAGVIEVKEEHVKRVEMTYVQNWCVAGGTVLIGLNPMVTAFTNWLVSLNKKKTCDPEEKVAHDKRDLSDKELLAQMMESEGYGRIDRSDFFENESIHGSDTAHFSDGITDIIIGNGTDGGSIATVGTREKLEGREAQGGVYAVLMHMHVFGEPPYGFNCHTTATRAKFHGVGERIFSKASIDRCEDSCYLLDHGGNWRGSLRIAEHRNDGRGGYWIADRTCNGF